MAFGLALLSRGGDAEAASIAFQAVATPATSICAAPCYQLRIFLEHPTRSLYIQAVQFELDVMEGASVSNLPIYPQRNSNASGAGTAYRDEFGDLQAGLPWNLASNLARRGVDDGFDVLLVSASDN